MSYQKHVWVAGEIIRGKTLNHIEEGIYNEEQRAKDREDAIASGLDDEYTRASGAESGLQNTINGHTENTSNPHSVTKAQVGLGSVPDVSTNDQTPTYTEASSVAALTSGEKLSVAFGKIAKAVSSLIAHLGNTSNPHGVTKSQVGLGSVGNFLAVSTVANQGLTDAQKANARTNIGAGASSFSGDYNDLTNKPTIGNASLVIKKNGTTVKTFTANATSNIEANITVPTKTSELTNDSNFISYKAVSTSANQGLTETEKANARANIGAGASGFSGDYNDLTNKPDLKAVATSGSYNDLTDKPTIGSGTVTKVSTGAGLTGEVTTTGTIKADLKSETKSSLTAASKGSTASREYAVGLDSAGDLSVNIPWSDTRDFKIGTTKSGATDNTLYFVYTT